MPSEGVCRDDEVTEWFRVLDDEDELTEADHLFLDVLRERAVADGWRCEMEDTFAFPTRTIGDRGRVLGAHELRVILSIDDKDANYHLLEYGIAFDGNWIEGDRMDSQRHDWQAVTPAWFQDEGSVPYLATVVAQWFASILDWPIEHREWHSFGQVSHEEWVIVSTGEVIVHNAPRMPDLPPDRVTLVGGVAPSAARDPGVSGPHDL